MIFKKLINITLSAFDSIFLIKAPNCKGDHFSLRSKFTFLFESSRWLDRAMVLGSFQCRGLLLLWHMVGQGLAVLAASVGQVGYIFFYFSSLSNVASFGRWLNVTEILWFWLLNPNGSCKRKSSLSTG